MFDCIGREIHVGDIVLYAKTSHADCIMAYGRVESIGQRKIAGAVPVGQLEDVLNIRTPAPIQDNGTYDRFQTWRSGKIVKWGRSHQLFVVNNPPRELLDKFEETAVVAMEEPKRKYRWTITIAEKPDVTVEEIFPDKEGYISAKPDWGCIQVSELDRGEIYSSDKDIEADGTAEELNYENFPNEGKIIKDLMAYHGFSYQGALKELQEIKRLSLIKDESSLLEEIRKDS